jgi:hypothetical protein
MKQSVRGLPLRDKIYKRCYPVVGDLGSGGRAPRHRHCPLPDIPGLAAPDPHRRQHSVRTHVAPDNALREPDDSRESVGDRHRRYVHKLPDHLPVQQRGVPDRREERRRRHRKHLREDRQHDRTFRRHYGNSDPRPLCFKFHPRSRSSFNIKQRYN